MKFRFLSLLTVAAFFSVSTALGKPVSEPETETIDAVLASCNGIPITLGDILPMTVGKENRAFSLYSGRRLDEEIQTIRRDAVDELIDKQIILLEYEKQTFRISSQDTESAMDRIAEEMGCHSREDFRRKLKNHGMDEMEFRKKVEENLIVQYMIVRNAFLLGDPTPREMYEYFLAHQKELSGVETIELAMLKVPLFYPEFEKVKQSVAEILKKSPERFEEMVKIYDPGENTGRIGEIECSKMRPEFLTLLTDHTPGKVYGPVVLEDGAVWLKILSHHEPKAVSFADMEEKIRETLHTERFRQAKKNYASELRNHNVIEYYQ